MPLFAFAFDEFLSQNSHSTNANFDQLRHITNTNIPCHTTVFISACVTVIIVIVLTITNKMTSSR